jgi:hypothetical protein
MIIYVISLVPDIKLAHSVLGDEELKILTLSQACLAKK